MIIDDEKIRKRLEKRLQYEIQKNKIIIKARESYNLEFKESFSMSNKAEYLKIMMSFANNKGGYIVFGIKDSPRELKGIKLRKWEDFKLEKFEDLVKQHIAPVIEWTVGEIQIESKTITYIYTEEALKKPVICRKDIFPVKRGEIYYRYKAQTAKIDYQTLNKLIEERLNEERQALIDKLIKAANNRVLLLDPINGELDVSYLNKNSKFLIDKTLLEELKDKINFIKEGSFSETEGTPTLKLIGNVEVVESVDIIKEVPKEVPIDVNEKYPYTFNQLLLELQKDFEKNSLINQRTLHAFLWKYDLKKNTEYCFHFKLGNKVHSYKYSKEALNFIKQKMQNTDLIKDVREEYSAYLKKKRKS